MSICDHQLVPMSVRAALIAAGIGPERWGSERLRGLTDHEVRVYRRLLQAFAVGRLPSVKRLQSWIEGVERPHSALARLVEGDLVSVDFATGQVLRAQPFAAAATRHRVIPKDGPTLFAPCAVDAIGVPFMIDRPATIVSTDPMDGQEVEIMVDPRGGEPSHDPSVAVTIGASSRPEVSACDVINAFASASAARRYLLSRPDVCAAVVPVRDATSAARLIFEGVLA